MLCRVMLKLFPILYDMLIDEKLCTNNADKDRERRANIMWLQNTKLAIGLNIAVASPKLSFGHVTNIPSFILTNTSPWFQ